jgi:hypothetical protein
MVCRPAAERTKFSTPRSQRTRDAFTRRSYRSCGPARGFHTLKAVGTIPSSNLSDSSGGPSRLSSSQLERSMMMSGGRTECALRGSSPSDPVRQPRAALWLRGQEPEWLVTLTVSAVTPRAGPLLLHRSELTVPRCNVPPPAAISATGGQCITNPSCEHLADAILPPPSALSKNRLRRPCRSSAAQRLGRARDRPR